MSKKKREIIRVRVPGAARSASGARSKGVRQAGVVAEAIRAFTAQVSPGAEIGESKTR
jgi:hypothetical protein